VDEPIREVRGSEVRCSGPSERPHKDLVIQIPADTIAACPECGRRYRRAGVWNKISSAIWPRAE
jgi:uncharacterized Zn-finger protein